MATEVIATVAAEAYEVVEDCEAEEPWGGHRRSYDIS
jgi:hypothetical protein